jgi:hypothetical protein
MPTPLRRQPNRLAAGRRLRATSPETGIYD